ncbi:MAG TPA: ADOP family duplicated permease [Gemmatimonadales bacterium]|jgi:predicted permease
MASSATFGSVQQDLHFALRTLRRNLGFALTVVATFALGIGATTAMLTVVHTVLIQPLPYPNADRIVFFGGGRSGTSVPDFLDYRASDNARRVFQHLAIWDASTVVISGAAAPEQLASLDVTPGFFPVLGIQPVLGRFLVDDDAPGAVVLSSDLWRRRFGGSRAIIGQTVTLDGRAALVVGVAPPLVDPMLNGDVFRPFDAHAPHAMVRAYHTQPVIGRLRPGVTLQAAQAAMALVGVRLAATYPEDAGQSVKIQPYADIVVGDARAQLWTLLAAVCLVFLIACANIASLMVARSATRDAELSTRVALGASGQRVMQQLVTESVLLALAGGLLGMMLAVALLHQLRITAALPRVTDLHVDGVAWLCGGALSLLAGVLVGVVSAMRAARVALQVSLNVGGRGTQSRRSSRARDSVIVLQVAASMILLSGAALLLQNYSRLTHVKLGFNPDNLMVTSIAVPRAQYDPFAAVRVWDDLLAELKRDPQVIDVAAASQLPFVPGGNGYYSVVGRPVSDLQKLPSAQIDVVTQDYFRTLQIPLVAGQLFDADGLSNGEGALVVSGGTATSAFPLEQALGKYLSFPDFAGLPSVIVGVAADVRAFGFNMDPPDVIYLPLHQLRGWANGLRLIVRTRGDPLAVTRTVRNDLFQLAPSLTLGRVRTMSEIIGRSTARQRLETTVLGGFACCALALAALGLYGLLAYSVATRRDEFAIRYALGVQTRQLFALVLNRGMALVAIGLGAGLILLPIELGVLRRTFAVTEVDTTTLVAAIAVLGLVGFGACVGPGINAVRLGTRWIRNN